MKYNLLARLKNSNSPAEKSENSKRTLSNKIKAGNLNCVRNCSYTQTMDSDEDILDLYNVNDNMLDIPNFSPKNRKSRGN